ncbi:MAG: hypothetical protein ACR2PK_16875 [Acidimicrobiales bacterium]
MLSSISPFGERSRNSRWWVTVTAYLLGSTLGGITSGLTAGLVGQLTLGWLSPTGALWVFAALCLIGAAMELGLVGLRIPTIHRQVNEDWLTTYRGWVYGTGFGFQLGLGWATIVTTSAVWLTWAAALLSGSWQAGLLIGATFGLSRGAVIFATRRIHDPASLRALFRIIAAQAPAVSRLATAAVGLAALTAIAGVLAA